MATEDVSFFEKWFVLLAKHQFGAALLPVAGISIGYFLVMSTHVMPSAFSWWVGLIGVCLIGLSAVLFGLVAVIQVRAWANGQTAP